MDAGGAAACSGSEAVTIIWACAVLGHTPQQLLTQLNTHGWVVKTNNSSSSGSSAAARGQPPGDVSGSAAGSSGSSSSGGSGTLGALRDSQLCTLAWSLACLQAVSGGLFQSVWCEVCRRGPGLSADVRQAVQLAQADLAIQLEAAYAPDELHPGDGEKGGGEQGKGRGEMGRGVQPLRSWQGVQVSHLRPVSPSHPGLNLSSLQVLLQRVGLLVLAVVPPTCVVICRGKHMRRF